MFKSLRNFIGGANSHESLLNLLQRMLASEHAVFSPALGSGRGSGEEQGDCVPPLRLAWPQLEWVSAWEIVESGFHSLKLTVLLWANRYCSGAGLAGVGVGDADVLGGGIFRDALGAAFAAEPGLFDAAGGCGGVGRCGGLGDARSSSSWATPQPDVRRVAERPSG